MHNRIPEIDYLKCVFILLMVAFHLVYIGDSYPYAKRVVYTFHMPGFLILSGYLARTYDTWKESLRKVMWIFIPYLCMETGYMVMSYWLPVREKVCELTPGIWLDKVFLHPIGPYWYLHTWMIGLMLHQGVSRLRTDTLNKAIVFGLALLGLHRCGLLSFANGCYFLMGCVIRWYGWEFRRVFPPAWMAILPLTLLIAYPDNLDRSQLGGVSIVFFSICLLQWTYLHLLDAVRRMFCFVGRNTLPILLFSPVFTFLSKSFLPLFAFEPTGILFLLVAVSFAVSGSIALAWLMDHLGVSRLFFGREIVII